MRLYQIVGKKARFPELPHVIAVPSERILHSLTLEPQFLHLNELQNLLAGRRHFLSSCCHLTLHDL
jgi:hypothetical protein